MTRNDEGLHLTWADKVGPIPPTTPEEARAAALTVAERVPADEVRGVLDMLGIGGQS